MTKKFNYVVATATTIAMLASATPAFAGYGHNNGGDVNVEDTATIEVSNWGSVVNTTTASASTGGNWAGGSVGGNGAEGGNGSFGGDADADADKGDANAEGGNGGMGGKGGMGGNGGVGGQIQTGNATAEAGTMNTVNTNDLAIEGCACGTGVDFDEDTVDDINVENSAKIKLGNNAFVVNYTDASAKTGYNGAAGSVGGNGAEGGNGSFGGDADADSDAGYHSDEDSDANAEGGNGGHGGKGGNGGMGGAGGLVLTGAASSVAGTINIVNTNLVRIAR